MSTSAQQQANRRNAEHSTGPKTDEGKARTSQNARRHGLCSYHFVLRREDQEEFDDLLADLTTEHHPCGPTEALLVQQMAQHFWLSQRAMALQRIEIEIADHRVPKDLAVLIRYQTTNERAFHKDLATLLALKKERAKQQIGSVPQTVAKPAQTAPPTPVSDAPATAPDPLRQTTVPFQPEKASHSSS